MATKKSTKKAATKKAAKNNSTHGFATVKDVTPITEKNVKSAVAREMSLRDFVLGALVANPEMTNEEVYHLVQKAGRDNAQSTTEWYAARVRQGHIKKG